MKNISKNIPIEIIRRNNQREQLKSLSALDNSDTSSDYNPNYFDFPNNKKEIINIKNIRDFFRKQISEKVDLIKAKNLSLLQKELTVLAEMNTSSESDDDNDINHNNDKNNDSFSFYEDESTNYSSYSLESLDEKKKYWIKFNLYDIIICDNNKKTKVPKLVELDEEKKCYLYLNKLKTYYFTKSAFLGKDGSINVDINDLDECKLNESLGLFFCGKNIEYNNENIICSPNNMICKSCMEKNKKRYNLENKYLININGRVAKKIKEGDKGFHCFGHFSIGKIQIENCLNKFCCQACRLLNRYEDYYFSK